MDEINDFFNVRKDFKREVLPSGYVNARLVVKPEEDKYTGRKFIGKDYGEEFRSAELEELKKMADIKVGSNDGQSTDDVYTRYKFNRTMPNLPIITIKDKILRTIEENPVVILDGATGSGKSTQVPQFILDDAYWKRRSVNIVVTQPRRIAAISIARRVAAERDLPDPPHIIGYQVGLKVVTSEDTRIAFCTTGVLLEKLVATKTLANYTHIILDEVHERSQDMDFLFIVIKQLRHTAPHVKIILMSATIEAAKFGEYFSFFRGGSGGALSPAPVVKVDAKSNYKVSVFYLDDLEKLRVNIQTPVGPGIDDEMYLTAVKLICVANRLDESSGLPMHKKPSVLVFLPGVYEIGVMKNYIEDCTNKLQDDNVVTILHSLITQEEQMKALRPVSAGKRLIILATNIAESSITVPDVKYVIDFCLTKNNVVDSTTNFTSLQLEWCSRNNCRQRAGRTGRTMDGRVYRLVTKHFFEKQMNESNEPEMCRSPLENVVLKAKQLDMGPPAKIISLAMDRPTMYDIQNTILLLKEAGALLRTCDGIFTDDDGDMTFIGHVMAALPININVAKLVVLGYCFSVLSDCIIIAAGLTTKSIFAQGLHNVVTYYSKKLIWSDGSGSDLFAILKAYKAYIDRVHTHGPANAKNWATRYYLNEKSLLEMSALIDEIKQRLLKLGIKEHMGVNRARWSPAETSIILKVVIAGAFYPNYFVRSTDEMEDRDTFHTINGRNPCNTVYFSGFEEKYIRQLYVPSIKKMMMPCTNSPDNIQVTFDEGNEKVFVSFRQTRASLEANTDPDLDFVEMCPGQVCIEVYKALKMRMSTKMVLRVMHPQEARKYVEQKKLGALVGGKLKITTNAVKNVENFCLPRKNVKSVTGRITHFDMNFNKFWLRSVDEDKLFIEIQTELNSLDREIEEFSDFTEVQIGQVVAAGHNGVYYRARVVSCVRANKIFFNVFLMDVGLEGDVEFGELRRLCGSSARFIDLPPRAFECRLACLQPSELHSERYGWNLTMAQFKKITDGHLICADIYSVESGVASVFVRLNDRKVQEMLIDGGYARVGDESFMSKVDHDLRVRTQAQNNRDYEEECDALADEMRKMLPFEEARDLPEPELTKRTIPITLKGPKTPLHSHIYMCLHHARADSKKVTVETNSVNSILLEANPQDSFEKYVVAANVTENRARSELTARETSIMPNVPGFGALMALIFAPSCVFFRDRHKLRYVAILCGLGEHPITKQPIYAEHDAVFNLDTDISVKDIEQINTIRFIMDSLLQMRPDQHFPNATEKNQKELTIQMKNEIIALLEKERCLMGTPYDYDVGWSKYPPNDLIKCRDVYATTAVFPLHSILTLAATDSPERLDQIQRLLDNNKELHRMAQTEVGLRRPVRCQLCYIDLEKLHELKIHLYSRLHTDREKKIKMEF